MTRRKAAPTVFASRVLRVVARIPAGRVATYGDIARLAGRPGLKAGLLAAGFLWPAEV
jgi:alkylated DNA nucleotide flippase Atl1